jgi:hypothetical protein
MIVRVAIVAGYRRNRRRDIVLLLDWPWGRSSWGRFFDCWFWGRNRGD